MKTFSYDHILRLENGQPIGRVILRSDQDYQEGKSFSASLVKIPKVFDLKYNGLIVWIDENLYKFPDPVDPERINSRETDDVISHVTFEFIGGEND